MMLKQKVPQFYSISTKSSNLNSLSDDPKRNNEITDGEFPRSESEPLFNCFLEEATTFTQDVSSF
jgi:hypothetical protein